MDLTITWYPGNQNTVILNKKTNMKLADALSVNEQQDSKSAKSCDALQESVYGELEETATCSLAANDMINEKPNEVGSTCSNTVR